MAKRPAAIGLKISRFPSMTPWLLATILATWAGVGARTALAEPTLMPLAPSPEMHSLGTIDRGFLFVGGRYVTRPYAIEVRGNRVWVNGLDVGLANDPILTQDRAWLSTRIDIPGKSATLEPAFYDPGDRPAQILAFELNMGSTVTLFDDDRPLVLDRTDEGYHLLKSLCSGLGSGNEIVLQRCSMSDGTPGDRWQTRLAALQATPELLDDAQQEVRMLEGINEANLSSSLWRLRADAFEYPLTIFATLLVVLSFGHLLSHRPHPEIVAETMSLAPGQEKTVIRSLLLVCGLSVIDLVWTVLAAHAGTMREINPLGAKFIDDPIQLFAFKLLVTSFAVGLLYSLRKAPLAHVASWWSCLVLTLVAARWLTFQSMLVA